MSTMQIWDIHGGIHPPERKELSNRDAVQPAPLPKRLIVPLNQHVGATAEPLVVVGEAVFKGQKIAEASGFVSAALHAPTSGIVSFVGPQPYPHVSGMLAPAIVIDSDGQEQWCDLQPCPDYRALEPAALLEKIRQAGISGLGGAGFPTAVKLAARPTQKTHTLIINGTECEPYITADDLLMREKAAELVGGIEILAHLIQPEQVLIGIEDNKPEAIAAVRAAVGERPFSVRVFPTKYPSGGEKQLIQILTGVEVPSGGLPADIGMLCQNVGSVVAIYEAVVLGKPLISRITTLTGEALGRPMNVEALLGTPVGELLEFAGLRADRLHRLVMGGPMMGFTLPGLDVPLIKTTNCLLAASAEELPPPPPALPCIRCGECAEACPASLLPQQLHFFALGQEHEQLRAHNLFDCIECGACAYVCPSNIPLVQYYRAAKGEIRELEQKQIKAEHSKQRFELRQERLRRAEEQKEAERQARAERAARAKAIQAETSAGLLEEDAVAGAPTARVSSLSDAQKKLKIDASMAQVALKKAEKQLAAHDTPELQTQVRELRAAAEAAQQALEAAMAGAAPTAPAVDEAALKKAKIDAAMLRAQLRKLEKLEAPDDDQQAELAHLRQQLEAAEKLLGGLQSQAPAAPAKAVDDGALKKAKIDAAMLRAQLRKLEKLEAPDDDQQAELAHLRQQLEAAEKLLDGLQSQAPAAPAKAVDDGALKKAKIDAAMLRAQVRKLEKLEAPDDDQQAELAHLRQQLEAAERLLDGLQNQAPPAPAKPAPGDKVDPLKKAKVELAMKRAELKKAEKAAAAEAELEPLRAAVAAAEQALHAAEAASAKPAPELERSDKRPVDEATRALKTELAFARADLRKLERDDGATAEALEAARRRLAEAEDRLRWHSESQGG